MINEEIDDIKLLLGEIAAGHLGENTKLMWLPFNTDNGVYTIHRLEDDIAIGDLDFAMDLRMVDKSRFALVTRL